MKDWLSKKLMVFFATLTHKMVKYRKQRGYKTASIVRNIVQREILTNTEVVDFEDRWDN